MVSDMCIFVHSVRKCSSVSVTPSMQCEQSLSSRERARSVCAGRLYGQTVFMCGVCVCVCVCACVCAGPSLRPDCVHVVCVCECVRLRRPVSTARLCSLRVCVCVCVCVRLRRPVSTARLCSLCVVCVCVCVCVGVCGVCVRLRRPVSTARLCSLSLYIVNVFLSFTSLTVLR